jgi:hypothetical protein
MIRYSISEAGLHAKISATSRGKKWLQKAAQNTAALAAAGTYDKTVVSENWSEIKDVFMSLQGNKCGYCERELEDSAIEHDVEHFRPKSSVTEWYKGDPPSDVAGKLGGNSDTGYYLLAFDHRNYLASCKTCNSTYKNNAFPVAKKRKTGGKTPAACATEKPYLVNPIGDDDGDPESLMTFVGTVLKPLGTDSRGMVIIAFFGLNRRDTLRRQRLTILQAMWGANAAGTAGALKALDRACDDTSPHASCARAYRKLLASDPVLAKKLVFPE